jgi:hypothetical protein
MNIKYINSFRHKTTTTSEENYFILQYLKACDFIQSLVEEDGKKQLNISKKEYIALVEEQEKKDLILLTDKGKNNKSKNR